MKYLLKCQCGILTIAVESDCTFLRITCSKCETLLVNQQNLTHTSAYSSNIVESQKTVLYQNIMQDKEDEFIGKHYRVIKLLGVGGYAKVYLAQDQRNNAFVAVKKMQRVDDPKAIDYFLRESLILRELKHSNIIHLYGVGNDGGVPFIVTEYVRGKSLEEIIKKQSIPVLQSIQIIYHILEGLKYASQKNIVHRDIKPSNILLTQKLHVKIIDMGISKMLNESYELTNTSDFLGTVYYMPFEQIRFCKDADHQADIYAVGATLYDMIARVPPFVEFDSSFEKIIAAKTLGEYISLKERCPKTPPKLLQIVEKAMAHRVEERYKKAEDMQQDLKILYDQVRDVP